jgi:uncharacterized integral membrane protein (TIGR00698 family)
MDYLKMMYWEYATDTGSLVSMNDRKTLPAILAACAALACLAGQTTPAAALGIGVALNAWFGKDLRKGPVGLDRILLQGSVVLLGFGMDAHAILRVGAHGMGLSAALLSLTFTVGWIVSRGLGADRQASLLVSAGTAICGGSAIAAVAASTRAKRESTGLSMGVVFLLNGVALLLFPPLGHLFSMSPTAFGTWAGLAIHDVSSVVGAATTFDPQSLPTAIAVKLGRTLWILPIGLVASWFTRGKDDGSRARAPIPLFLAWFLAAAAVTTLFPGIHAHLGEIRMVAHGGFNVALFLIGMHFDLATIRHGGGKLLLQGVAQWILVAVVSFLWIR